MFGVEALEFYLLWEDPYRWAVFSLDVFLDNLFFISTSTELTNTSFYWFTSMHSISLISLSIKVGFLLWSPDYAFWLPFWSSIVNSEGCSLNSISSAMSFSFSFLVADDLFSRVSSLVTFPVPAFALSSCWFNESVAWANRGSFFYFGARWGEGATFV